MKRHKKIARGMIITGTVLTIIGFIIALAKGNSITIYMSMPILLAGILISQHPGKHPSAGK